MSACHDYGLCGGFGWFLNGLDAVASGFDAVASGKL
jgi:hypothetical protein